MHKFMREREVWKDNLGGFGGIIHHDSLTGFPGLSVRRFSLVPLIQGQKELAASATPD